MRQLKRWGGLVLLLLGLVPTLAQTPQRTTQVAVLVLMDVSGSMGGAVETSQNAGNPTNIDPQGNIRAQAITHVVDTLGSLALTAEADNTRLAISLAQMNFNSATDIAIPWTALTPENETAWQNQKESLIQTSVSTLSASGETNFTNALRSASNYFDNLEEPDGEAYHVILLVTDGVACAPNSDSNWQSQCNFSTTRSSDFAGSDRTRHFEEMRSFLNSNFRRTTQPNQRMLLLQIGGTNSEGWKVSENEWNNLSINKTTLNATDAQSVGNALNPALLSLIRSTNAITGDIVPNTSATQDTTRVLDVLPYQQQLQLVFLKSGANFQAQITRPNGRAVSASDADVLSLMGRDSVLEVWKLSNPDPGQWRVVVQNNFAELDSGVQVLLSQKQSVANFTAPANGLQYEGIEFSVEIRDDDGRLLPNYSDTRYQIRDTIRVTAPDNTAQTIDLQPDGAGKFTARWTPTIDGTFTVRLELKSGSVLRDILPEVGASQLTVTPVSLRISGLEEATELLQGASYRYEAVFTDSRNTPLDITPATFSVSLLPNGISTCSTSASGETVSTTNSNLIENVVYQTAGNDRIACVSLSIPDPSGGPDIEILRNVQKGRLTVIRAELVNLALARPQVITDPTLATIPFSINETEFVPNTTDPIAFVQSLVNWQRMNLVLDVRVISDTTTITDPLRIADDLAQVGETTSDYLTLSILNANGRDVAKDFKISLKPIASAPYIWEADLSALPPDTYRITINTTEDGAIGNTNRRFSTASLAYTVVVTSNALYPIAMGGAGLTLGLIALGAVVRWGILPYLRRRNPPSGTIGIYTQDGTLRWHYDLSAIKTNNHTLKLSEIPLVMPPLANLNIRSNASLKAQGGVKVSVLVNGEQKATDLIPDRAWQLYTNSEGISYYLVKFENSAPESLKL